jgi:ADP-ribose pyrophosphatase
VREDGSHDSRLPTHEKPEAAKLGWEIRETAYEVAAGRFRVRRDRIVLPTGDEIDYVYEERPDAVGIVPVTADGMLLFIWQYRYPIDTWCLEIPAGGTRDHQDLSLEEVARLELREETGATCGEMEHVGFFYVKAGSLAQRFHVFIAWDAERVSEPAYEPAERIEQRPLPVREALALARSGQMPEAHSALALLLCEERLRARGYAT